MAFIHWVISPAPETFISEMICYEQDWGNWCCKLKLSQIHWDLGSLEFQSLQSLDENHSTHTSYRQSQEIHRSLGSSDNTYQPERAIKKNHIQTQHDKSLSKTWSWCIDDGVSLHGEPSSGTLGIHSKVGIYYGYNGIVFLTNPC